MSEKKIRCEKCPLIEVCPNTKNYGMMQTSVNYKPMCPLWRLIRDEAQKQQTPDY